MRCAAVRETVDRFAIYYEHNYERMLIVVFLSLCATFGCSDYCSQTVANVLCTLLFKFILNYGLYYVFVSYNLSVCCDIHNCSSIYHVWVLLYSFPLKTQAQCLNQQTWFQMQATEIQTARLGKWTNLLRDWHLPFFISIFIFCFMFLYLYVSMCNVCIPYLYVCTLVCVFMSLTTYSDPMMYCTPNVDTYLIQL